MVETIQLGSPRGKALRTSSVLSREYLNGYVSGAILMCGAIEGVVMGLNEIRTRRKVAAARKEARREARQEGIRVLEQAGKGDSAQILKERSNT